MHVALIANTAWLDEELTTFGQLTVGLIDEQVKLTRVMPDGLDAEAMGLRDVSLFGQKLTWSPARMSAVNHRRIVKLCDELEASGADLIHALHSDLWQPASVIGDELDLPVVFGASSLHDVRQAGKLARQLNPTRCVFAASTEPIAIALREATENLLRVVLIPPGVHASGPDEARSPAGESLCVAVCGDGVMDDQYQQFLEGVAIVVAERPEVQFFFDGQQADQHQVWKAAMKLGLLGNLSFVPRRLGHRDMLLMADALVHPQTLGRSRSVTLLAMGQAVPVLAAGDEMLDYLLPDETAWVLDEPDGPRWADLLLRLVYEADAAVALGQRARAWVGRQRVASDQIERTLRLYRESVGEPLPFAG